MKRTSKEEFIKRSIDIHGDIYDYSLIELKNQRTKIIIICKEHGKFKQLPYSHLNGNGCPGCSKKKQETTNIEKYGHKCSFQNEYVKRKIKETNIKKYGSEYSSSSKIVRDKVKKTNIEKYGGNAPMHSENVKKKSRESMLSNHGVEYSFCSTEITDKARKTMIEKYGENHPMKVKYIKDRASKKKKEIMMSRYNRHHNAQIHLSDGQWALLNNKDLLLEQHHIEKKTLRKIGEEHNLSQSTISRYLKKNEIEILTIKSHPEQELISFINEITSGKILIEQHNRNLIPPQEIDIYIPDKKLAIEYNGLFWHSEFSSNKDKNYHLQKTELCNKQDIKLIHIFENEWLLYPEIVKSIIRNKLGYSERIYARKCHIIELDNKTKHNFLLKNHIQGDAASSINIGLVYNNEIVAIGTFSKPRFNKNYQYELIRFASLLNYTIVGGASKIFKYFLNKYHPESVISYCDLRYGSGILYEKLGFEYSHQSSPNFWYFNLLKMPYLYSRVSFQKYKLENKLKYFDPLLSAWENMKNNGYDRIWDCGNSVWIYKR